MELRVDTLDPADRQEVLAIFGEGITTRLATFETELPDWETWERSHLAAPRLAARLGERLVGWAALNPVSSRDVYRGVAEVSVYVAAEARGRGIGDGVPRERIKRGVARSVRVSHRRASRAAGAVGWNVARRVALGAS